MMTIDDIGGAPVPRHWIHYVFCADEAGAHTVARAAKRDGWELRPVAAPTTGDEWIVVAEQKDVVITSERVDAARLYFEALAATVAGGDYDGWEASV